MLDQMQIILAAEELIEISMQKMEKSVVLKEDIAHFYRLDKDDNDRNCDFLIRSVEDCLGRERYRTNRANDLQSMLSQANRDARTGAPSIIDPPGRNGPSEGGERRKKKRQERKAKVAAAKAAAAPAPTPAGKGKGKGPGKEKKVLTTSISLEVVLIPPKSVGLSTRSFLPLKLLRWCSSLLGLDQGLPPRLGGSPGRNPRLVLKRMPLIGRILVIVSSLRSQEVVKTPTVRTCILMKR